MDLDDSKKDAHLVSAEMEPASKPGIAASSELGRPSLCGIYADLGLEITAEEIDEARREAWANFPRDGWLDPHESEQRRMTLEDIRPLFKETQELPQALAIDEATMAAEIEDYRAGR